MASQTFSPADRIRELNELNASVPALLNAAGEAIAALSPQNQRNPSGEDTDMADIDASEAKDDLTAHKQAFETNAKAFYSHVQALTARFRRQAYALEEAGIISRESTVLAASAQQQAVVQGSGQGGKVEVVERVTNGGLGNLDVGYLNSKGNKVGAEKKAELMGEAKDLLKTWLPAEINDSLLLLPH